MAQKAEIVNFCWSHRKILVAKAPSRYSYTKGCFDTATSARIKKHISVSPHQLSELSEEQLQQAKILANIVPLHLRLSDEPPYQDFQTPESSLEPISPVSLPSPIISLHSKHNESSLLEGNDWESVAARAIAEKKFTLNDSWSTHTWKNKTSISVRLKLLKDDGYDISPLQHKGVTSGQVTEAVLAHIGMRKQNFNAAAVFGVQEEEGSEDEDIVEKLVRLFEEDDNDMPQMQQPNEHEYGGVIGTTELISHDENIYSPDRIPTISYDTYTLVPNKRKHCHDDEDQKNELRRDTPAIDQFQELQCTCGPIPKRLRVSDPVEARKEIEVDAFRLFKRTIRHEIFRLSRAHYLQSLALQSPPLSSIGFAPSDPSPRPRVTTDVQLGTRGLAYIMDELQSFSDFRSNEGTIFICDPEVSECVEHGESFFRYIRVAQDSQHGVIMEGDAYALAGLMQRIRKHDLVHTSAWIFDGTEVVRKENYAWSLSHGTDNALARIEGILLAGAPEREVNVRVEQIYNGKKLRYNNGQMLVSSADLSLR